MGVGFLLQAFCIKTPGQTDLGSFHEQRSRGGYVEALSPRVVKGLTCKLLANSLECENSSTRRLLEKQGPQTLPTMTRPSCLRSLRTGFLCIVIFGPPSFTGFDLTSWAKDFYC